MNAVPCIDQILQARMKFEDRLTDRQRNRQTDLKQTVPNHIIQQHNSNSWVQRLQTEAGMVIIQINVSQKCKCVYSPVCVEETVHSQDRQQVIMDNLVCAPEIHINTIKYTKREREAKMVEMETLVKWELYLTVIQRLSSGPQITIA